MWSRRDLLIGGALWGAGGALGGALGGAGCAPGGPRGRALEGEIASAAQQARSHRLREPFRPALGDARRASSSVDVLILGAGVAGLTAAFRLARAGFQGSVRVLELADQVGGTAAAGVGRYGPYPWGAHYITLPSRGAVTTLRLLHALGIIEGFDADGCPSYPPEHLCLAPEERLYALGAWRHGLWPEAVATQEDIASRDAFEALVARFSAAVGGDGRPAFAIPLADSSIDPLYRSLADVSFDTWLTKQGLQGAAFRWWVSYGARDDFGAEPAQISAWAGLHYHCARRPWVRDAWRAEARDLSTHVLTWPSGNGSLVSRLRARLPWPVELGVAARQVVPGVPARVWVEGAGGQEEITAKQVILAVPSLAVSALLGGDLGGDPGALPQAAPWRVAQLQVRALPASRGVGEAWDSVLYGARSLGYVSSAHQLGHYQGPTTLTWYEPWSQGAPSAARQALQRETWASAVEAIVAELRPAHPDIEALLERVDVWHWGHGTVVPSVGLHAPGVLERLRPAREGVQVAHTDLSGMSLFEEASWHGIRAAEAALSEMGRGLGEEGSWLG